MNRTRSFVTGSHGSHPVFTALRNGLLRPPRPPAPSRPGCPSRARPSSPSLTRFASGFAPAQGSGLGGPPASPRTRSGPAVALGAGRPAAGPRPAHAWGPTLDAATFAGSFVFPPGDGVLFRYGDHHGGTQPRPTGGATSSRTLESCVLPGCPAGGRWAGPGSPSLAGAGRGFGAPGPEGIPVDRETRKRVRAKGSLCRFRSESCRRTSSPLCTFAGTRGRTRAGRPDPQLTRHRRPVTISRPESHFRGAAVRCARPRWWAPQHRGSLGRGVTTRWCGPTRPDLRPAVPLRPRSPARPGPAAGLSGGAVYPAGRAPALTTRRTYIKGDRPGKVVRPPSGGPGSARRAAQRKRPAVSCLTMDLRPVTCKFLDNRWVVHGAHRVSRDPTTTVR